MVEFKTTFSDLGLKTSILEALTDLGYKKPSPIQMKCIPHLLSGRDVLGMSQTGSGKTAAFSLPLLNNINPNLHAPQVLILSLTRELAIQVAEVITDFSKHMYGVNVVAIYGGQSYDQQLRILRQGPQIIVGTPGRLLDYLRRNILDLSNLSGLVLDEADEMLRMGFIEDVEAIMSKIPTNHQTALFSATMPKEIRRITRRFMKEPQEIFIQSNTTTRPDINQSYWIVYGMCKHEALVRFLEAEDFDAAIIFVRTKDATLKISDTLKRNGYNSAALNGDMNQALREKTLTSLREGRLDILIATDIAARGLDVERVDLVVNYDIPMDSESYIHRIGRTGRAGRDGRAILFVENYERRLLRNIERAMKLSIPEIKVPNSEFLGKRRLEKFVNQVKEQLKSNDLEKYRILLMKIQKVIIENHKEVIDTTTLSAALLKIAQGELSLILPPEIQKSPHRAYQNKKKMELYRIEVGLKDGIEVKHIINTIAKESNINSRCIGNIRLFSMYSTIELPKGVFSKVLKNFSNKTILNKPMKIRLLKDSQLDINRKESENYKKGCVFRKTTKRNYYLSS